LKEINLALSILLLFTSCSTFVPKQKKIKIKKEEKTNFCPLQAPTQFELIGKNKELQIDFLKFIKSHGTKLSPPEIFSLYAINQINYRPDLSSPMSQMMIIDMGPNYTHYYKTNESDRKPLLELVNTYLKDKKTKLTIKQIAYLYDKKYKYLPEVDQEFATFLKENASSIKTNDTYEDFYTRGNEVLRTGESLKKINILPLLEV